jgi:hypothetical protein
MFRHGSRGSWARSPWWHFHGEPQGLPPSRPSREENRIRTEMIEGMYMECIKLTYRNDQKWSEMEIESEPTSWIPNSSTTDWGSMLSTLSRLGFRIAIFSKPNSGCSGCQLLRLVGQEREFAWV